MKTKWVSTVVHWIMTVLPPSLAKRREVIARLSEVVEEEGDDDHLRRRGGGRTRGGDVGFTKPGRSGAALRGKLQAGSTLKRLR